MDRSSIRDFVPPCIDHLGNTLLVHLVMQCLQPLAHVIIQYQNMTLVNITTDLIKKVFNPREVDIHGGKNTFFKIQIFARKLKSYHGQQILSSL